MKKWIISVLLVLTSVAIGVKIIEKASNKEIDRAKGMSDKHLALFLMMNQWVKVKQSGKNLASYFNEHGYKKIAIYGMSYAGETLLNELKDSEIKVVYGIDKKAGGIYADIETVSADDILEDVDAVVVTAITFFGEIEEKLSQKMECPIICLEDILYAI